MSLFVLDTDTLSLLQKDHPAVSRRVRACTAHEVAITIITVEEQLTGWYTALRKARKPAKLPQLYDRLTAAVSALARLPILSFSDAALTRFQSLSAQRLNIGKMDLRIAAIVLELGAVLVTRNRSDFQRIAGLIIEDWST